MELRRQSVREPTFRSVQASKSLHFPEKRTMSSLAETLAKAVESLDPKELAILAKIILDAAIAGDFLALNFLLEAGLRDAERERFAALRAAIGFPSRRCEDEAEAVEKR